MSNPALSGGVIALMLMVYADPKQGKTALFLRTFPNAAVIGLRANIEFVARNTCGFSPKWVVEGINTLPKLVGFLQDFLNKGWAGQYPAVYVDDFSHICQTSLIEWKQEAIARAAKITTQSGKYTAPDTNYAYGQLDMHLDWVSGLLRQINVPCGLSCHEVKPNPKFGSKGAPEVPSRQQLQAVPSWADYVGRLVTLPEYPDPFWSRALWVDKGDDSWISGDRTDVSWTATPPNLREILRASAQRIILPRLPGCEWQDDWADYVCGEYLKGTAPMAIAEAVWAKLAPPAFSDIEQHVRWAYQDGIARGVLQQRLSGGLLGRLKAAPAAGGSPPPPPK